MFPSVTQIVPARVTGAPIAITRHAALTETAILVTLSVREIIGRLHTDVHHSEDVVRRRELVVHHDAGEHHELLVEASRLVPRYGECARCPAAGGIRV